MYNGQTVAAVLVAAGSSTRMGFDKLLYEIEGTPVFRLALQKLDEHPGIDELVVVAGQNMCQVQKLLAAAPPQKPLRVVGGGATRTHSVAAGVAAVSPHVGVVAIHDAARPFVSGAVITRTLQAALHTGAAAPCVPVKDTIKQKRGNYVQATPPRGGLCAVQTPQIFNKEAFENALQHIGESEYATLTDDCMVMERAGKPVQLVEGDMDNCKITTPHDLCGPPAPAPLPRIGHGYDVHRLAQGRPLIIGGVNIPYSEGLLGHSDADVLLHAVADALLGAAALGDIGAHFPDTDARFAGANSLTLLQQVVLLVRAAGYRPANIDATLLCQAPKLAPHIPAMRRNIAQALAAQEGDVSVKATTEEGLGFTGLGQGIAAHCVALLVPA